MRVRPSGPASVRAQTASEPFAGAGTLLWGLIYIYDHIYLNSRIERIDAGARVGGGRRPAASRRAVARAVRARLMTLRPSPAVWPTDAWGRASWAAQATPEMALTEHTCGAANASRP